MLAIGRICSESFQTISNLFKCTRIKTYVASGIEGECVQKYINSIPI